MIFGFLRRLFTSDSAPPAPVTASAEAFDHQGYRVQPAPLKEASGWRVAGEISREIDGVVRQHQFVRADVLAGEEEAVSITASKAKRLIDEQGDRIFREPD